MTHNSLLITIFLVFTTRLPDTAAYMLGDKIVLECETANEALNVKWTQNGRDLSASKEFLQTMGAIMGVLYY